MIYQYRCEPCKNTFEVTKPLSESSYPERCEHCQSFAQKLISKFSLMAVNDWTESFNPAFGRVVKNKAHQREILKELKDQGKEFIEVGNEPVEKIHKHFDRQREEKQAERWNESTEKVLHEGLK